MSNSQPKKWCDTLLIASTFVVVFLWSESFQLRVFKFSDEFYILRLIATLLIVLVTGICIFFNDFRIVIKNFYFLSILGLIATAMLPTFLTGTLLYDQQLADVVRRPLFFYALLIFVPLFYYPIDLSTLKRLNKVIVLFGVSLALFQSVLSFVPEVGKTLLNDSVYISSRYELIRMTVTSAMLPCVLYAMFYLITTFSLKQNSILYALELVILLYYVFFVCMARSTIFGLAFVWLLFYIFYRVVRKQLLLLGLLILLLLILSQTFMKFGIIDIIKGSAISIEEEVSSGDGTIGVRMSGIRYYWHEFQRTCFLGTGMVSRRRGINTTIGIGMTKYKYNPADQGIFSVVIQFGFQALVLTIIICHHMFRDLQFVVRYGILDLKIIAISVQLYLFFKIVTFSHMFLWHVQGLWWGLFFFITWKMRDLVAEDYLYQLRENS